jgi:hypothetical protein
MRGCVLYGKVRFAEHDIRTTEALARVERRAPLHGKDRAAPKRAKRGS